MALNYQIPTTIFDSIPPKWRHDILHFIDSGDASEGFLKFLDDNVECQNVVETAFTLVSQDVATTARQLKASNNNIMSELENGDTMNVTFARLFAHMLLALVELDSDQQNDIVQKVGGFVPATHKSKVLDVVNGIDHVYPAWLSSENVHIV